ncbi:MAG: DUF3854 domain-containing protein [Myxococcales bacterium]|nr:DUF3854 domain-containing protein [Myxococcales bacterium]
MLVGNKLRPGFVGVVQVTSIEVKPTEYGECAFTEFTVVETNIPEQHWCGAPVVWVQSLKNVEIAKSAFKEFLQALKVPETEMESAIKAAIESPRNNALTNRRVRVQTHETQTKNGPFIVHNWFPFTPADGDAGPKADPAAADAAPPRATPPLRPEHLAYLEQRAVPPEVATAAGLVSVDATRAALLLQLLPEQVNSGGLAIPYPHVNPKFWRVRMDGAEGGAKFMAPPGRGAPIYDAVVVTEREVAGPLVVTEGPIKALALVASGIRGIGLGGAETGLTKEHKLDPSWDSIEIPAEGVVLLPDADINDNYGVMRGTARLARALTEAHPELTVKLARLPGPGKRGPDDHLAEHGAEALRVIVEKATSTRPSGMARNLAELDKDERSRRIAQLLEDKFFLVSVIVWAEAENFLVRELFKKGGAVKALDKALKDTAAALRQANRYQDPTTGIYRMRDGKFWVVKPDGSEEQLTNFTARITREKKHDDGVEETLVLTIRMTRDNGDDLGEHNVPADEFGAGRAWVVRHFSASAVVFGTPGAMGHTRAAIQMLSGEREKVHAYSHTGYRELVDATGQKKLVYLHAEGAIGGDGVVVCVDPALARYRFPDKAEDVRGAVLMSLRMLDVAVDRISCPLLGTTYLAPLTHWIQINFVKWSWGPTGSFKTSVEAVGQSHYGDFDGDNMPAGWTSTPAWLEYLLSRTKDAVTTIDDFVPKSTHEQDEMRRKAAQIVRSVGNNSSRGRMRADLTARPDRPPRCLCIVTGEEILAGESSTARTLVVRYEKNLVRRDVLTELQLNAKRLPHAMRGYIEYLISQDAWLRAHAKERVRQLRAEFANDQVHARQPGICARLMFAAEVFAGYAMSIGVFDQVEANAFLARFRAGLLAASTEHATTVEERKPVTRFANMLAGLVAQGRVRIENDAQTQPMMMAGETFIGCRDGDRLRLLPEPTFRAVTSAMRDAGDHFPVSSETLWAEFRTLGFLAEHEPGRTTKKLVCGGVRTRVVVLWSKHVEGEPEAEPPPDPPGAAPPQSPQSPDRPAAPRTVPRGGAHLTPTDTSASGGGAPIAPPAEITFTCSGGGSPVADGDHSMEGGPSACMRGGSGAIGAPPEKSNGQGQFARPDVVASVGRVRGAAGRDASQGFVLVNDPAQLPAVAEALPSAESVALDTETTGLDRLKDRVRLVQLGLPDGRIFVIDVWATGGLGPVAEVLGRVAWLGHNLAFDLGFMRQLDVTPTKVVDTMLLAQVVDCGLNLGTKGYFTLSTLLKRHLGIDIAKDEQKSDWSGGLRPEQLAYAARDVAHLHDLVEVLTRELEGKSLAPTGTLECDVLPAVVDMALAGVRFDRDRWTALTEQKRREAESKALVERELRINNANSPKQLLPALQQRHGADLRKTDAEALAPYASDPVVAALLKSRAAATFVANHGDAILEAMAKYADGRVRSHWSQIGVTGRMASSDPPLLNLPKSADVRSCVVPSPDCVFVRADLSQIELRVAAQVIWVEVGDEQLLNIFRSGGDVHRTTAALIAGVPEDQITDEQRARAKPVNFGFLFGMGAKRFVGYALKDFGVVFTLDEARRFKAAYLRAYPGVARWQALMHKSMPTEVRTLGGRIRAFPDRRDGYSHRLNHPIQGTALDGFKAAMVILSPQLAARGARIVLAVHDELVVEAPEACAEEVRQLVEAGMREGMARFVTAVPIKVDAKIVRSWAEAK